MIALKGHFLTHIPHPMQRVSEMKHILLAFVTSMHILQILFGGHTSAHSYEHFFGLHLSGFMIAIRSFSVSILTLSLNLLYYYSSKYS